MVDRYLLRYFLAVLDCGNFSKAARQLNVAQPSLSVGIGKLERLLGTALFQRNSKRVQVTDAGARLAAHARRIEHEFNLAEASVRGMRAAPLLRLGVLATFPIALIADAIKAAGRSPTRERLQLVPGNERELLQRLARGQIDVALSIVRGDEPRVAAETLMSESYTLAVSATHPLADRASIAAEELADNTMLLRRHCEALSETSRYFTARGVRPFFAYRGTNDEQVLCLVAAGLGVTVMPDCYVAPGVARPRLAGFATKRRIGLLYSRDESAQARGHSPIVEALRMQLSRPRR